MTPHHHRRRLATLARSTQVIVVTHLAQVAAFANNHLNVVKDASGAVTSSSVRRLEGEERLQEMARLLSGLGDSASGIEHARELLVQRHGVERFDQHAADAERAQRFDLRGHGASRHEYHRNGARGGIRLQRRERGRAVHGGHHHVEQDRVGAFGARLLDAGGAGGRLEHFVLPDVREAEVRDAAHVFLVVDDQDLHDVISSATSRRSSRSSAVVRPAG